jgi:two-component system LytT family response regulator
VGNKKFLVSKALGDIEEILPADIFQRIHHSTIVNMQHITNLIRSDGGYLVLNNGEKLIISKAKKNMLLQRLGLKKD